MVDHMVTDAAQLKRKEVSDGNRSQKTCKVGVL